jgi:hypothetical protein
MAQGEAQTGTKSNAKTKMADEDRLSSTIEMHSDIAGRKGSGHLVVPLLDDRPWL